jgi:hypothetical protein
MSKNIKKIQDMVSGGSEPKIRVGYVPENVERVVGDIWVDLDDIKWEQKKGYKIRISNLPGAGIFGDQCSECKKGILSKGVHRDTYNRMGRCYHCQINFEVELKSKRIGQSGNKWQFWVKLQQLRRWVDMDKEAEDILTEIAAAKSPFDKSVANALANENRKQWKKDAGG